jgi:tetratricopeptide (TPR) repeat protein
MERAARENPDVDQVAIQTAIIAEQLGETEKAIATYRTLLAGNRLSGTQAGIVAGNLAWLLARPDTADEAAELVERAVRDLGPHPDLLDTRALVRLAKGQAALALEDMDDALLSPSAVKYVHLAAIRMAVNDLEGAKAALEQSQKLGLGDLNLQPDETRRVKQVEAAIAAGGRGDS